MRDDNNSLSIMERIVRISNSHWYGSIIRFCMRIILLFLTLLNRLKQFFRFLGISDPQTKKIKSLKGNYNGKRCFIIATGPSLKLEDLNLIKNEFTFGMNSIINTFDNTTFRPSFYGIQDHIVYNKLQDSILRYYEGKNNVFVSSRIKSKFKVDKHWIVFPLDMVYHAYKRRFKNEYKVRWSSNPSLNLYSGFSITYSLIVLAIYMGFSDIYLLGADCDFSGEKVHFQDYGVIDKQIYSAKERNLAGYKALYEMMKKLNTFKIYNCTRGGKLEIFQRVKLEEVLKGEKNESSCFGTD